MKSKLSIWSFVLSFLPIPFVILFFSITNYNIWTIGIYPGMLVFVLTFGVALTAITLGAISLKKIKENKKLKGKSFAITGIIIGSIHLLPLTNYLIILGSSIIKYFIK